jgi:hypothetical protein
MMGWIDIVARYGGWVVAAYYAWCWWDEGKRARASELEMHKALAENEALRPILERKIEHNETMKMYIKLNKEALIDSMTDQMKNIIGKE